MCQSAGGLCSCFLVCFHELLRGDPAARQSASVEADGRETRCNVVVGPAERGSLRNECVCVGGGVSFQHHIIGVKD